MILFYDIFQKAVNLFDDPDIRYDYVFNKVSFAKRMREYLMAARHLFGSPTAIVDKLSIYSEATYGSEIITNESGDTFVLSVQPDDNSVFTVKVNNEYVLFEYNKNTNSIVLQKSITINDTCVIEWYFAGAFTADFSHCLRGDFPMNAIMERIVNILAKGIECMWDEEEMNRALENRNTLSDTDFKLYSPANSVNAKREHHKQVLQEMDTLISELNWRILGTPRGGSSFGR